ncbi:pyocin activator PrtN family protein [Variovorax sp. J22G73]|uniref:pyocin activator PrtN family protein n=1 Tax=unclassified Variovorax TaxID=663243 RepID=UPI002577F403|nr:MULTISPECIES: pyocin activator PrtN family protein [unclassified Variovorax]MDM0010123.1 pyocin activator PrtN family protein [Variovorax sp. J22R203]MDM0103018.1 pyocin activator PrtN family protein [Variovorax sp. J22G73]
MKTELMLLLLVNRPVLRLHEVANLLSLDPRSLQNKIYRRQVPFPMFKMLWSGSWVAHVSDVAAYIDEQKRDAEAAVVRLLMQQNASPS